MRSLYEILPYTALWYGLRTDMGGCKFPKIFWRRMAPDSLKASGLCAEVCTNVVCSSCALSLMISWLCHSLKAFLTRSGGLALFGVNFRPLQEIEAINGGGRMFDTGLFFTRLHIWFIVNKCLHVLIATTS